MVITIAQTASNLKQTYAISCPDFTFHASAGSFLPCQSIRLTNDQTSLTGTFRISNPLSYIPFWYKVDFLAATREFRITKNGEPFGSICQHRLDFHSSYYTVCLSGSKQLNCYAYAQGRFHFISIYDGDQQIASLVTDQNVRNFKYFHYLYLLDTCRQYAEILSFFAVYFANYHFAHRFHMSISTVKGRSWTISNLNFKYDPSWLRNNFPDSAYLAEINHLCSGNIPSTPPKFLLIPPLILAFFVLLVLMTGGGHIEDRNGDNTDLCSITNDEIFANHISSTRFGFSFTSRNQGMQMRVKKLSGVCNAYKISAEGKQLTIHISTTLEQGNLRIVLMRNGVHIRDIPIGKDQTVTILNPKGEYVIRLAAESAKLSIECSYDVT